MTLHGVVLLLPTAFAQITGQLQLDYLDELFGSPCGDFHYSVWIVLSGASCFFWLQLMVASEY
jgi:hypothetical protein